MFHFVCNKSGGDEGLTGCIKLQGKKELFTICKSLETNLYRSSVSTRSSFSHEGAHIQKTRGTAPSHFKPSHSNMQYRHCSKYQRTHKTKL